MIALENGIAFANMEYINNNTIIFALPLSIFDISLYMVYINNNPIAPSSNKILPHPLII